MQNKILINTIILYIKIVITMLMSFISVPIVLRALGAEDYGVYMLVAGVIAMLTFLNNAMAVATQRYLSVTIGKGNQERVTNVFTCSVYLHILIGLIVCGIFEIASLFLFDGFLNITHERIPAAKSIYQSLVISTFFVIISVPYDAALNAKENMLVFSLAFIIASVLRLLLAISLLYVPTNRLILYGIGMACIQLIEVFIKRKYVLHTYKDMHRLPLPKLDKSLFKEMFVFSGWNTFGAFAGVCRNQGIAIVLNLFFGTIINTAYGVANQVNGILLSFSGSLQKAINPQLMQSEGAEQRTRMLSLAETSIKMSVLIFATIAIPLILEMDVILEWWLGVVPEHTIRFCQLVLLINLIAQFTVGIMAAIQAMGQIKMYQISMSVILFINLPISYLILYFGGTAEQVIVSMFLLEMVALLARLLFARQLLKFSLSTYLKTTLIPLSVVLLITFFCGLLVHRYVSTFMILRVGVVVIVTTLVLVISTYYIVLNFQERALILNKFIKWK